MQRSRECLAPYESHGDEEMGSLVSDTQNALPRHRACCNRKPGNGTRAVFVAISGTSASRERFQRVSVYYPLDPDRSRIFICPTKLSLYVFATIWLPGPLFFFLRQEEGPVNEVHPEPVKPLVNWSELEVFSFKVRRQFR